MTVHASTSLYGSATVPEDTIGCWERPYIRFLEGTEDKTTRVIWLQTLSGVADIRIAASLRDRDGHNSTRLYAFAAQAASTAGALPGLLVMLAFGLGTFPAMLMMGGVGQVLAPVWRQRGVWLAGSFILLLGLITLGRGVMPLATHVGHAWAIGPSG
jgi:Cytochrome C biogenesis protein transmembrane region